MNKLIILFSMFILSISIVTAINQSGYDNFNDGDFTNNPHWTSSTNVTLTACDYWQVISNNLTVVKNCGFGEYATLNINDSNYEVPSINGTWEMYYIARDKSYLMNFDFIQNRKLGEIYACGGGSGYYPCESVRIYYNYTHFILARNYFGNIRYYSSIEYNLNTTKSDLVYYYITKKNNVYNFTLFVNGDYINSISNIIVTENGNYMNESITPIYINSYQTPFSLPNYEILNVSWSIQYNKLVLNTPVVTHDYSLEITTKNQLGVSTNTFKSSYDTAIFNVVTKDNGTQVNNSICNITRANYMTKIYQSEPEVTICNGVGCTYDDIAIFNITSPSVVNINANQDVITFQACFEDIPEWYFAKLFIYNCQDTQLGNYGFTRIPYCRDGYALFRQSMSTSACYNKPYATFNLKYNSSYDYRLKIKNISIYRRQSISTRLLNNINGVNIINFSTDFPANITGYNPYRFIFNCTVNTTKIGKVISKNFTYFEPLKSWIGYLGHIDYNSTGYVNSIYRVWLQEGTLNNFGVNNESSRTELLTNGYTPFSLPVGWQENTTIYDLNSSSYVYQSPSPFNNLVENLPYTDFVIEHYYNYTIKQRGYYDDKVYHSFIVRVFDINICQENWIAQYSNSTCNGTFIIETKTYYDNNTCGTNNTLPIDNNTINLYSCSITTTVYYTGIDIPKIGIDAFGSFGVEFSRWIPLIFLLVLIFFMIGWFYSFRKRLWK
jgi:hypothetical protein